MSCSVCGLTYDLDCANLSPKRFLLMNKDSKKSWKCQQCRSTEPKTGNVNTPVQATQDNITLRGKKMPRRKSSDDHPDDDPHECMRSIIREELKLEREALTSTFVGLMTDQLKNINDRITSIEGSLSSYNLLFNNLGARLDESETRENTLRKDLFAANITITELSNRLKESDQQGRLNNLEISGVPVSRGENLHSIVNNIAVKVGFKIDPFDIDYLHRVRKFPKKTDSSREGENSLSPRSELPPNIIVRFTRRHRKRELIAAVRARRGLTTADVGIDGAAKPIFVNDHLCPHNKIIYRRARELGKQYRYKYIWLNDCKIFLRKNDTSRALFIGSESDLAKIK